MSDNIVSFSITPQNTRPLSNFSYEQFKNKPKQFTISHDCVKKNPKINFSQNQNNYFKIDTPSTPKTPKIHKKTQIQNSEFSEKKTLNKKENLEKIEKNNESQNINQISIKENENSINNTNSNKISNNNEFQSGRWTDLEHQKFIEGILEYGNEWKKVQGVIKTRSSTQARSHAQKFFLRIKKNATNPLVWDDQEKLLDYIINSNIELANKKPLTISQKKQLLSAIRSNLKPDEKKLQNENINKNAEIIVEENEEEDEKDNLGYNKDEDLKNIRKNSSKLSFISDFEEKDKKNKMKFLLNKRKSSSTSIFNIEKDFKHRLSMEISQPNLNKLVNNFSNNSNNINLNNINNINEENMKQDNYTNTENNLIGVCNGKEKCFNCGNWWGNSGGNYIINNNYINITNNYSNCYNSNNNTNISPCFMNNFINNNQNSQNYLYNNNDSINSDIINNNSYNYPKFFNNNTNIFHNSENNCNSIFNNIFEEDSYSVRNNEIEENNHFLKFEFGIENNNYPNSNMESHIAEERDDEQDFEFIKNNNDYYL